MSISRKEQINKIVNDTMSDLMIGLRELVDAKTRTCINCKHFNEQMEVCTKFNARPPARIIALSCEHYEDAVNDTPF